MFFDSTSGIYVFTVIISSLVINPNFRVIYTHRTCPSLKPADGLYFRNNRLDSAGRRTPLCSHTLPSPRLQVPSKVAKLKIQ